MRIPGGRDFVSIFVFKVSSGERIVSLDIFSAGSKRAGEKRKKLQPWVHGRFTQILKSKHIARASG